VEIKSAKPAGTKPRPAGWAVWQRLHPSVTWVVAAALLVGTAVAMSAASFYTGSTAERRMGLTEKLDRVLYQDIHPLRIAANYLDSFRTSPERLI
jgi:hypothetical protein